MKLYSDKDVVDAVVVETGEEVQIPKKWIGTEFADGYDVQGKADKKSDEPVVIPEGDPSDDWTVKQIDAYAEREGIDLGEASKKGEKLAVIEDAKPGA